MRILLPLFAALFAAASAAGQNVTWTGTAERLDDNAYRIVLEADRTVIAADGKDYAFVTVRVEDRQGTPCPLADNEIRFEVTGAGYYRAGANGNPASLEPFQRPRMKLFSGMMTAVIAPTERPGTITVKATSPGLKKATVEIRSEAATQR